MIRVRDADADMRGRLLDEIEYMTEMDHPNIVELNTAFLSADGSTLYVALGFLRARGALAL